MTPDEIRNAIRQLKIFRKGNERAPHKPLLILLALGRCQQGEPRWITYQSLNPMLRQLLEDFGPPRRSIHPEYPFWYLQFDGIWELRHTEKLVIVPGRCPSKQRLMEHGIEGGFTLPVHQTLTANPNLIGELAHALLDSHFPASLHDDLLQAVGLDLELQISRRRPRDPEFRRRILRAYEYRCAVCGFDVRLGSSPVALEAAHILWHQAGGPDIETNGVALCVMHHRLFDRGVFTLETDLRLMVSEEVHGTVGFQEWLLNFHGQPLRAPQRPDYYPNPDFTAWHVREVFRGRYRHL